MTESPAYLKFDSFPVCWYFSFSSKSVVPGLFVCCLGFSVVFVVVVGVLWGFLTTYAPINKIQKTRLHLMEQIKSNKSTPANARLLYKTPGYSQTHTDTRKHKHACHQALLPESYISPESLQYRSRFLRSTIFALDSSVIMINRNQWTVAGFHLWKTAAHQIPLHPTPHGK